MKTKSFLSYLWAYKSWVFVTILLVLLAGLAAEFVPFLQGLIVGQAAINQNESAIWEVLVALAVMLVLDMFARCFLYIISNKIGFGVAKEIRNDFFEKLMKQPYQFFVQRRSGDMVFRANIFIYSIGNFLSKNIADTAIGFTRVAIIFVYLLVLNAGFALVLLGIYSLAILFAVLHSHKTYRIGKAFKHFELHRNSLILQNLDHIDTYLAYNDDFSYLKHYARVDKTYHKLRVKYHFSKHLFYPCLDLFVGLGTVVIYWLTLSQGLGAIEVGVLVAMLTYASRMILPIQQIAEGLAEMIGTSAIISKIMNFVNKPKKHKRKKFSAQKFDIVCQNVAHKDVATGANFENLNLDIPFGQKVAIVGAYGNGKSAFADLLLGLNRPQSGSLKFGGTEVVDIKKSSLPNLIAFAGDDAQIFGATVFENVQFAKPSAGAREVVLAAKNAGLLEVVDALPNGIHTRLAPESTSETIKQLIAFARVILKNPPVIVFDEFTRDLAPQMQKKFFANLKKFAKNKTMIYICQKAPKELHFHQTICFQKNTKIKAG
ncbi:MAG: ABC transporter ATP-binding protein [Clostridia bacterium]|nr:ABC transporter ATP-binding protein [Clostridia bacterium]MBR2220902.1 ABC transporter ATP-binding protein [Clostridia bacterium]MBR3790421.1 ABC transporter ATP-binding protein [Clostridia bacterium]